MESKESLYKEDEESECICCASASLNSPILTSCSKTEDELLRELAEILVEAYLGDKPYGREKGSDLLSGFDKRTS